MITIERAKERLQGVCIPLATIFKEDGSLDVDTTRANAQWIIDQGAREGNTIFIACGSGGDFSVQTTEERKQAISAVAEASAGRIPIIASVQDTDIRQTIELCQHCEEVGVEFVQMSSAYYYDVLPGDIVNWVKECAKHTDVGFAAYSHHYSGSKYDMTMDVADQLLDIPNTVAVKWGSPNIGNYLEGFRRFVPRAAVVNNGPLTIYGHVLGCNAWVSHVPNFFPQHSWHVWDLMKAGDYVEAQRVYDEFMLPYSRMRGQVSRETAGEGIFVKPWMEAAGLVGGPSRLPSRDAVVTAEMRAEISRILEEARARESVPV